MSLGKRVRRAIAGTMTRLGVLAKDESGNVAMLFGLAAIPFFAVGGMAVDFSRALDVQTKLGAALDATALALGAEPGLSQKQAEAKAKAYFKANYPDSALGSPSDLSISFTAATVSISATATVDTLVIGILPGWEELTVSSEVEVQRNSTNLEVSLVLDVTGSMGGSKIVDLRDAATKLVDILVWDDQSVYTSKIALVPYSMGVNVGAYADQVRGPLVSGLKNITGATKANPVVITSNGHGFTNGQRIYISNVNGMTQLNDQFYTVAGVTANTFQLKTLANANVDGRNYSNYSSSGRAYCGFPGCTSQTFVNMLGNAKRHNSSTCVSERIGAHAYTDAAPTSAFVGYNYPPNSSSCPTAQILPLTSNKTTLKTNIAALPASGSTAGQIGIAWGWYMLSPNFGYLWPAASRPEAYGDDELLKISVIMTDGQFNSPYCDGVIAQDAQSGSGNSDTKINCNATNGDAFDQAAALCTNMKDRGIIVYTVGFELGANQEAIDVLASCASQPSYAYVADDGDALIKAFQDIAIDISNLRISR
jgi:Flp pilus assembly protein TadG